MNKFLVIVFDTSDEGTMPSDEVRAWVEIADKLGILVGQYYRERRLIFDLLEDLTPEQYQGLDHLKKQNVCTDYHIVDRVIDDTKGG